ncbi:MAG: hypothetical protein RSD27_01725 [Ruthenibacterium sp.]
MFISKFVETAAALKWWYVFGWGVFLVMVIVVVSLVFIRNRR